MSHLAKLAKHGYRLESPTQELKGHVQELSVYNGRVEVGEPVDVNLVPSPINLSSLDVPRSVMGAIQGGSLTENVPPEHVSEYIDEMTKFAVMCHGELAITAVRRDAKSAEFEDDAERVLEIVSGIRDISKKDQRKLVIVSGIDFLMSDAYEPSNRLVKSIQGIAKIIKDTRENSRDSNFGMAILAGQMALGGSQYQSHAELFESFPYRSSYSGRDIQLPV